MSTDGNATVQSVGRAFAILEAMADLGGEVGVSELSERLGVALPTIHRLLRSLLSLGYVRQLPSRRYALGPSLVRLGDRASAMLATWARPVLEDLEKTVQETANLAVLDGDMAAYVAQVPSRRQMRMFTEVGRRVYLHSTGVGKALLSQLPDDRIASIVSRVGMPRYTDTTITTLDALLAEIRVIRTRGYSIDEGEQEQGVRCLAIVVPDAATPSAVSVSGPDTRITLESAGWIVPALRHAAAQLTQALGSDRGATRGAEEARDS